MGNTVTEEQAEAIRAFLADDEARMRLYWIINKDGERERFRLNWAQRTLHRTRHTRNNILKARQLGMSTYMAMRILDKCLFTPNASTGIVDRTLADGEGKLRKIKFAFDNLDYEPPNATDEDKALAAIGKLIKAEFAKTNIITDSATFDNGSRIDVSTSFRGGTMHLLHISELGSISAHDPVRAAEIVRGGLPAVGKNCELYLESTHEGGKYGENYNLLMQAMECIGRELAETDFKFFFFPWYEQPEYRLDEKFYHPTEEKEKYFNELERDRGIAIDKGRRAWYCSMERTQGSKMKQEFPSTPEEALNPIMEGTIYADQIGKLREEGLLKARFEVDRHRPIYAAWDIGVGDYMSIWWVQPGGDGKWHLLDCFTANNKDLAFYLGEVRRREGWWGRLAACVTPHDGARRDYNLHSFDDSIRKAGYRVIRVPRTKDIWADIDATRDFLNACVIHERCSEGTTVEGEAGMSTKYMSGVDALSNYRTLPAGSNGALKTAPLHDQCSHACDALRCFAMAVKRGLVSVHGVRGIQRTLRVSDSNYLDDRPSTARGKGYQSQYVRDFLS